MPDSFAELLDQECVVPYEGKDYLLKHPKPKDTDKVKSEWISIQDNDKMPAQQSYFRKLKVYERALAACTGKTLTDCAIIVSKLRNGSSVPTPVETKAAQLCGLPVIDVSQHINQGDLIGAIMDRIGENENADPEEISKAVVAEMMDETVSDAVKEQEAQDEENESPLS